MHNFFNSYKWIIWLVLFPLLVHAAVYKRRDAQGNVYFSDQPSEGSKQLKLPPPSVVHQPPPTQAPPAQQPFSPFPPPGAPEPYKTIQFKEPVDQQTFQNQRKIVVKLNIEPSLKEGDKVQLFLNGHPIGQPIVSTQFVLQQLNRGEHQLQAAIVDRNGQVIKKSRSITIFVHYASVGSLLKSHSVLKAAKQVNRLPDVINKAADIINKVVDKVSL